MAAKRIHLAIDTPCQQHWQDMKPESAGRFCDNCQKTVVDFSGLTDQQIAHLLAQPTSSTCGRFRLSQLNRNLVLTQDTPNNFLKQRWLGLVMTGLMSWSTAQGHPIKEIDQSTLPGKILTRTPIASDGKIETPSIANDSSKVITGQVLDEYSKNPLVGVNVFVKGSQLVRQADTEGRFRLSVPHNQVDKLVVVVSAIGFKTQEITINSTPERPLVVFLNEDAEALGEVVRVGGYKKLSFWQRLRNRLRSSH